MRRNKYKGNQALKRRQDIRKPKEKILIVCEGSKTEPKYFKDFANSLRLSTAKVTVADHGGSAPISVVQKAMSDFKADATFDRVYCVFDRDKHPTYDQALSTINSSKLQRREGKKALGKASFEAITSVPCFEYWILLHFQYTTAHFDSFTEIEQTLKNTPQLTAYQKGQEGLFALTQPHIQNALSNADRANTAAKEAGTDNPTTKIPDLVRYLLDISDR